MDIRIKQLASNLLNYSCKIKEGEKVYIEVYGNSATPLVKELVNQTYALKAMPFIVVRDDTLRRAIVMNCCKEQLEIMKESEMKLVEQLDAFISIKAQDNVSCLADVPSEKMKEYSKYYRRSIVEEITNNKKWVTLNYPNNSMAQLSNTSLEAFEDFYFNVCNLDYNKMSIAMDNLVKWMKKTDKVHVKGVGTDLTFSIKDIEAIKCAGKNNIPDGEVFTAPVKNSVNGYITYNCPAIYQSVTYENIRLEFKDGKIIKAEANDTERINKVFDTDEGARYIGEFAIGVNPYITKPMKDILFDEKIMGSFHFTPGNSYEDAPNGNKSNIHWDLVCIQTPEYGGGEIYFDDVLIRKDGLFVVDELKCLNPENLK